jgi:hypothetical protein
MSAFKIMAYDSVGDTGPFRLFADGREINVTKELEGVGGRVFEVWNPHKNKEIMQKVVAPLMLMREVSVCLWIPSHLCLGMLNKFMRQYGEVENNSA